MLRLPWWSSPPPLVEFPFPLVEKRRSPCGLFISPCGAEPAWVPPEAAVVRAVINGSISDQRDSRVASQRETIPLRSVYPSRGLSLTYPPRPSTRLLSNVWFLVRFSNYAFGSTNCHMQLYKVAYPTLQSRICNFDGPNAPFDST